MLENQVDADRVYHRRERLRHIDVRVVGHRRLLRERRDHRDVVTARRQCLHDALIHHPVAAAVDGKHAENIGSVGGGGERGDRHHENPDELHLKN